MTHQTFGDLLKERLSSLGLDSYEEAIGYLGGRGLALSDSTLSSYITGARSPRPGRMKLLLDALDIHGEERLLAYELVAALGEG